MGLLKRVKEIRKARQQTRDDPSRDVKNFLDEANGSGNKALFFYDNSYRIFKLLRRSMSCIFELKVEKYLKTYLTNKGVTI